MEETVIAIAAGTIFSLSAEGKQKQDELTEYLYQQIGQLKVELDWLKKKSGLDT